MPAQDPNNWLPSLDEPVMEDLGDPEQGLMGTLARTVGLTKPPEIKRGEPGVIPPGYSAIGVSAPQVKTVPFGAELQQPGSDSLNMYSRISDAALTDDDVLLADAIAGAHRGVKTAPAADLQFTMAGGGQGNVDQLAAETQQEYVKAALDVKDMADSFKAGVYQRQIDAENLAMQDFDNAKQELIYGKPIEDINTLKEVIKLSQENPQDFELGRKAAEAHAVLATAAEEAQNPDPFRLWNNMDTSNQVIFLIANAFSAIGNAIQGNPNGATPWNVAMQLMDRDYQAQKEAYERSKGKVDQAQNAYAMVARKTDSEIQRYNLMKAMKFEHLESQLAGTNLAVARQQVTDAKQNALNNLKQGKYEFEENKRLQSLKMVMGHRVDVARLNAEKRSKPPEMLSEAATGVQADAISTIKQLNALTDTRGKLGLLERAPGAGIVSKDRATYDTRREMVLSAYGKWLSGVTLRPDERERVEGLIKSALALGPGAAAAGEAFKQFMLSKTRETLSAQQGMGRSTGTLSQELEAAAQGAYPMGEELK